MNSNRMPNDHPYIDISRVTDGNTNIVKATLFRQSIVFNRIFAIEINEHFIRLLSEHKNKNKKKKRKKKSKKRKIRVFVNLSAHEIISHLNIYNLICDHKLFRIAAALLWVLSYILYLLFYCNVIC